MGNCTKRQPCLRTGAKPVGAYPYSWRSRRLRQDNKSQQVEIRPYLKTAQVYGWSHSTHIRSPDVTLRAAKCVLGFNGS